jgi:high-affinity K+ transport system ATPase subunit B
MRTRDDPVMHAQNLPFGDNAQLVGINPQADRTIGKGGRHAVAVAIELDQAGW